MGRVRASLKGGLFAASNRWLFASLFVLAGLIGPAFWVKPASAAVNEQVNYQGRLLDSTGAIVPDGTYNMEFKIYQDGTGCVASGTSPCSGTLKWTETRTTTNRVTLRNGYFSVQLGEVTPFASSVDWNQSTLWLSVNVGGTATSPTWDGEMLPFRRMAASPYALNAAKVGGLDISKLVQLGPSAVQVESGSLSSIHINKTGSGNILELERSGADVFLVSNIGAVTSQNSTDSINAFRVLTSAASSGATVLNVDTTNQRVGVGGTAGFSKFEVIGGDAAVYNNGNNPRLILGDSTAGGQNGYLQWDSANDYFRIESVGSNGLKIKDNFMAIGNMFPDSPLKIANGSTLLLSVGTTGDTAVQTSTDSTTAFRVLQSSGAGGAAIFTVDTSGNKVLVGNPTADAIGTQFVLDTKNTSGDPTGQNGGMYYNSNTNKFRCYQNGGWTDCIGTGGGSGINNSTSQQTANYNIVSAASGSIAAQIQGAASGTVPVMIVKGGATPGVNASLLELQDSSANVQVKVDSTGKTTFNKDVLVNNPTSTSAFVVQGSSTAFVTVNTSASKFYIGNPDDCGGRFCVTNTVTGSAGSTYTNSSNNTLATVSGASTFIGQEITLDDDSSSVANTLRALRIDTSGSSNTGATINSILARIPTTNTSGNFLSFQRGSSIDVVEITNTGSSTFATTTNAANGFRVLNASNNSAFNIDTTTPNLISNSSIESNTTGWAAKTGTTLTRTSSQYMDGNYSMSVATTTTNAGANFAYGLTASTQYTFSAFVKASGSNFSTLQLGYAGNGSTDTSCVTGQTAQTDRWLRLSCTFTTGAVSGSPYVYIKQTDATARTFYIDAIQLETGSSATQFRNSKVAIGGSLVINGGQAGASANNATMLINQIYGSESGLFVKGSGEGNLFNNVFNVQSYDGVSLLNTNEVTRSTNVSGGNNFFGTPAFKATSIDGAAVAMEAQGASGQTADIFRVLNNGGSALLKVGASGKTTISQSSSAVNDSTAVVEQTGSGDTTFEFKNPTKNYFMGIDASDGGVFKLSSSTAASAGNFTVGYTTPGAVDDSGNANMIVANKLPTNATAGSVSSVSFYVGTLDASPANRHARVAIYADNGSGTQPGALIATSGEQTLTANSWNSFPVSAAFAASTTYWAAFQVNSANTHMPYTNSLGAAQYFTHTYSSTWDTDLSADTPVGSATLVYSMYITVTPSGTPDSLNNGLLRISDSGATTFRNSTDSTTAFRVVKTNGDDLLSVDTSNSRVNVGLLQLSNQASDPSGLTGDMYYNTTTGKFRCFEGAAWVNCIGSGGGSPGGSTTQIQFNDGGAFGGEADLVWDKTGNDLSLNGADTGITIAGITNEPGTPSAGTLHIYSKSIAGRMLPKIKGPSGLDTPLQPALFGNNIAMLIPSTGTGVTTWGMGNSATGTISNPTIASTNLKSSMRRIQVASATTASSAANVRSPNTLVWRGNATGLGGFFYQIRFGVSSTTTNQTLFAGLHSGTGALAGTQVPSALVNMIGVGWDSADTSLQLMRNDASGTATKVALGASYPVNNTTAVYELTMFAQPNGSNIAYRIVRLDTNVETSGTVNTDIPANTTFLTHHAHMTNGGTAAAVNLDVVRVYVESDY